jgi:hypothetical protein
MPSLLTTGATVMCAHGGTVSMSPAQTRVTLGGQPAATLSDVDTVAGCPFVVANAPSPCVQVQWITAATRVTIGGSPALLQTSQSTCIPNGTPASVVMTQTQVMGL